MIGCLILVSSGWFVCYRLDVGSSWGTHSWRWVGRFYLCLLIGFVGLGCLAGVHISVSGIWISRFSISWVLVWDLWVCGFAGLTWLVCGFCIAGFGVYV